MIYYIGQDSLFNDAEVATVEEAIGYLEKQDEIGLDIETTKKYNKYEDEGLDPYTSNIVMFQIGTKDKQYIIDARVIDITKFKHILENPLITKVGHNLGFEYKHLIHRGIKLRGLYDTMLAEICIFNGHPTKKYGLGNLIQYYFNKTVDKDTRLEFLSIGSKHFTMRQIQYGADDITYPLAIKQEQAQKIEEAKMEECVELENQFLSVLARVEYNGMNFNTEKWLALYDKNLVVYKDLLKQLDDFVLENYRDTNFIDRQLSIFDSELSVNIKT